MKRRSPNSKRTGRSVLLGRGEVFHLPEAMRGERMRVEEGLVWATVEGDATDYLVHEGESLTVGPNTVLEALRPARVRIEDDAYLR